MDGKKKLKEVGEVRSQIFLEKYMPKNGDENISCIKTLDGNTLPPCHCVLLQKMKRTNFLAKPWRSSVTDGWNLTEDGSYKICWFDGDASAKSLDVCTVEHVDDGFMEVSKYQEHIFICT